MDQTLASCRIVITRPEEQAEEMAEALRSRGANVRVRPLVRLLATPDAAPLRRALERLSEYDWVAFTSVNAVKTTVALAPAGASWPAVACVGRATAEAARAAGMVVALVPAEFTGEALARELAARGVRGVRVLWPRAESAREVLRQTLQAAGAVVDDPIAYRTEPDRAAAAALAAELAASPADVALFLSPSAVRTMASAASVPRGVAIAAIGGVTAAAATGAGMQVSVQPAEHSVPALVAALESWWAERNRTDEVRSV